MIFQFFRSDLENQLGISWSKVTEIVRRADLDSDGIIHYKDLLETVQNYRMNTEQASTLKSIFKAFAYYARGNINKLGTLCPSLAYVIGFELAEKLIGTELVFPRQENCKELSMN